MHFEAMKRNLCFIMRSANHIYTSDAVSSIEFRLLCSIYLFGVRFQLSKARDANVECLRAFILSRIDWNGTLCVFLCEYFKYWKRQTHTHNLNKKKKKQIDKKFVIKKKNKRVNFQNRYTGIEKQPLTYPKKHFKIKKNIH